MKKLYINNLFSAAWYYSSSICFYIFFPFVMWIAHAGLLLLVLMTCIDIFIYSEKKWSEK
jgi:hypothetical protein